MPGKLLSSFHVRCDHCRKPFRTTGGFLTDRNGNSPIMALESVHDGRLLLFRRAYFLCAGRCDARLRERLRLDPNIGHGDVDIAFWTDLNELRVPANRDRFATEVAAWNNGSGASVVDKECLSTLRGLFLWLRRNPLRNLSNDTLRKVPFER